MVFGPSCKVLGLLDYHTGIAAEFQPRRRVGVVLSTIDNGQLTDDKGRGANTNFSEADMQESAVSLGSIHYRQAFPPLRLLRAFRIAVDVRKLFLAGLAAAVLSAGNALIDRLPFAPRERAAPPAPWNADLGGVRMDASGEVRIHPYPARARESPADLRESYPLSSFLSDPWSVRRVFVDYSSLLLEPFRALSAPGIALLTVGNSWSVVAEGWTRLLWGLGVWAVFGGALTRMAAVQFARDEHVGMWASLRFAGARFLSYFSAPLLPLVGFAGLWVFCLVGGWVGRIPLIGEWFVGLLWIVPLLLSVVMALILIGVAAGWPLMLAAVSVEGSDAFDGFSRAYSYLYNRPWYCLASVLLAVAYGSATIFFMLLMAWLVTYLAGWSVSAGMGAEAASALFHSAPLLVGGPDLLTGGRIAPAGDGVGGHFVGIWLRFAAVLVVGYVYSFFWTAWTIIYFLLRKSDDGVEFDVVYRPEDDAPDELLPLVGVAASDQVVIERPVTDQAPAKPPEEVFQRGAARGEGVRE